MWPRTYFARYRGLRTVGPDSCSMNSYNQNTEQHAQKHISTSDSTQILYSSLTTAHQNSTQATPLYFVEPLRAKPPRQHFSNMKIPTLVAALMAALALAINGHSHYKGSLRDQKQQYAKPQNPKIDQVKNHPLVNGFFEGASKLGIQQDEIETGVEHVLMSPGFAAMVEDLSMQKRRGASIDQLIARAMDTMVGEKPEEGENRENKSETKEDEQKQCIKDCERLKRQQCFFKQDGKMEVEDCRKWNIKKDCKGKCPMP